MSIVAGVDFGTLNLGGRAPRKNEVVTRVYADVLGKPVLVDRRGTRRTPSV